MGRVGVDLYPEQFGVPLAEVQTFAKYLGGTATNVAVAAARYGHSAAVITKVGDDGFGPYVRAALNGFGVDDVFVGTDPDLRTPIVFCEIYPPDRFPLLFYREPKAPDMNLRAEDLDFDAIQAARILLDDRHRIVGRAQPNSDSRRPRRPRPLRDHHPRPGLPADVLEASRRGFQVAAPGAWSRSPLPSAISRSVP